MYNGGQEAFDSGGSTTKRSTKEDCMTRDVDYGGIHDKAIKQRRLDKKDSTMKDKR